MKDFCRIGSNSTGSLVLDQSRKARPFITETFLMGRKESMQTNKQINEIIPLISSLLKPEFNSFAYWVTFHAFLLCADFFQNQLF